MSTVAKKIKVKVNFYTIDESYIKMDYASIFKSNFF